VKNSRPHLVVIFLFAGAIACYLLEMITTAIALSAIGVLLEIVAWVVWLNAAGSSSTKEGSSEG
jgi:Mn2+/Fe2+ NRAMP family transporter